VQKGSGQTRMISRADVCTPGGWCSVHEHLRRPRLCRGCLCGRCIYYGCKRRRNSLDGVRPAGAKWTRSGQEERIVWNEEPGAVCRWIFQYWFLSSWSWNIPRRVAKENARNNSSSILSRDNGFSFILVEVLAASSGGELVGTAARVVCLLDGVVAFWQQSTSYFPFRAHKRDLAHKANPGTTACPRANSCRSGSGTPSGPQ
jgi:hypothetical protein